MTDEPAFPGPGEPKRALLSYWIDRAGKAEDQLAAFLAGFATESRCRICKAEVWWLALSRRRVLLNADLTQHATCREQALAQRRPLENPEAPVPRARRIGMGEVRQRRQKARLLAAEKGWWGLR